MNNNNFNPNQASFQSDNIAGMNPSSSHSGDLNSLYTNVQHQQLWPNSQSQPQPQPQLLSSYYVPAIQQLQQASHMSVGSNSALIGINLQPQQLSLAHHPSTIPTPTMKQIIMRATEDQRAKLLFEECRPKKRSIEAISSSSASLSASSLPGDESLDQYEIDEKTNRMLIRYAETLCGTLLEQAIQLSKNRGSKQVDEKDIALLLSKFRCAEFFFI